MELTLIILSAVLYSAANYVGELYFLNWIALIPFLYSLFLAQKERNNFLKRGFFKGWQLGFFILAFSANFLYHSICLYTGLNRFTAVFLLVLVFLVLSLVYGIFIFLYLALVEKLNLKAEFNPFLFACSWLIFEWSRYYLLSFFPLANPAYSQAQFLHFIQLAEYGGIWTLSFILILVNGLLFGVIFRQKHKNLILIMLIFAVVFLNGSYQLEKIGLNKSEEIKVGIITTEIKQQDKWKKDQFEANNEIVLTAFDYLKEADLIIAPETNLTFDFYNNSYQRDKLIKKIKNKSPAVLQLGALAADQSESGRFNSSFLISAEGEILQRYNKNLLLLFGENFPYQKYLNRYTPFNFRSLKAGREISYFKTENLKWKTVICSEILYPHYVKVKAKELDFIVNQTNEAWFADTRLVKNIMWQAAVIRAVENRIPVIKTGNQAKNGIIYPSGRFKRAPSGYGTNFFHYISW